jgi:hypothetical protein
VRATDRAKEKQIAEEIQRIAQFPAPLFWNVSIA